MKLILTKDVKGKGKVNDIIECNMGYANFLLRDGSAVEATDANIQKLKEKLEEDRKQEAKHLEEMKALKEVIDSKTVTIAVKVGASGKLFGSVSTKEIVEVYKKEFGIELDKRKIIANTNIDAIGLYKLPISLHKDVCAYINVKVVEGK
ncbi:MAG: 50S ribosomal protein L9 [Bacilli bacterium]|nr:50S ribosomal protein L9 [Bacilli bacterium]